MSQTTAATRSGSMESLKHSFLMKYEFILFVLIALIVLFLSITTDGNFWNQGNLSSVLVSVSIVSIAAVGATLVIITSGIDISAGSVLGLTATVVALGGQHGLPLWLIIVSALATGCIAGFINGYLIAVHKVPAIIVTLGTLSIWRSAVFMLLGGSWGTDIPMEFSEWFIMTKLAGVPLIFWLVIVLVLVSGYMMNNRKWGRYIYALGNNEEATVFAGLPTKRLLVFIYVIAGLLVAVSALVSLGQSPIVQSSSGQGFELSVIAAVVIGGASISGGRGSIMGAFLGAILVELVRNAVILLHIQPFWTGVVMGVMIIIAVLVSLSRDKGGAN
ncbi:ABC transporter permease [Cohnella kolymensis]|nr:ABC transporter permease [Cohnella kolymensis]